MSVQKFMANCQIIVNIFECGLKLLNCEDLMLFIVIYESEFITFGYGIIMNALIEKLIVRS